MKKNTKYVFAPIVTICSVLLLCPALSAMPSSADPEKSFSGIDANNDGKVTPEEFFAKYPQMKDAAFTAIDKNNDGVISLEEWTAFTSGHSKDNADAHQSSSASGSNQREGASQPQESTKDDAVPDLLIPAK